MTKFKLLTIASLVALSAISSPSIALAERNSNPSEPMVIEGVVIGISDGDTITILDDSMSKHKIRLTGIDAPESKQAFGSKSKYALSDMVYRKRVAVLYETRDVYGRILGSVIVDRVNVNAEQVKNGMAWAYQYCNKAGRCEYNKDSIQYAPLESSAKALQAGLWRDATPTPPWQFRKSSKFQ